MAAKMKTIKINGVPYVMRADMNIPEWKGYAAAYDPFKAGARGYLTTPAACTAKRVKDGDGCAVAPVWAPKPPRYDVIEEIQIEMALAA